MKFFARVVFICNLCFIASAILRLVEVSKKAHGYIEAPLKFQPLVSTLVILGYSAVFLNAVFLILSLYRLIAKRVVHIPRWMLIINLLMLPLQVYYFFYSKF